MFRLQLGYVEISQRSRASSEVTVVLVVSTHPTIHTKLTIVHLRAQISYRIRQNMSGVIAFMLQFCYV